MRVYDCERAWFLRLTSCKEKPLQQDTFYVSSLDHYSVLHGLYLLGPGLEVHMIFSSAWDSCVCGVQCWPARTPAAAAAAAAASGWSMPGCSKNGSD